MFLGKHLLQVNTTHGKNLRPTQRERDGFTWWQASAALRQHYGKHGNTGNAFPVAGKRQGASSHLSHPTGPAQSCGKQKRSNKIKLPSTEDWTLTSENYPNELLLEWVTAFREVIWYMSIWRLQFYVLGEKRTVFQTMRLQQCTCSVKSD